ncbi:hypothetical protein HYU13_05765 [Candidatus Woesearchaeota archaeon]|nr:hypothetical protein [Candidatus Woesearchaeota archaeon]
MAGKGGTGSDSSADIFERLSKQTNTALEPLYNPHGIRVVRDTDLVSRICDLGLTEVKDDFDEARPNVERYKFEVNGEGGMPDLTIRLSQYPDWYSLTGNKRDSIDPKFHADAKIEIKEPSNDTAKEQVIGWIISYVDRMAKPC